MTPPSEPSLRRPGAALGAILAIGFLLRLLYLAHVALRPGFVWDDPDSYMRHGLEMATGVSGGSGWHFDWNVVEHRVEGGRYVLPPLYPVFLSVFALLPGYPLNAQVGQALLATLSIFLVFLLGRSVHSDRTGLLAAAVMAVWLPNVIAVWSTMQEALYVPLVLLSLVLLLRARAFPGFVIAGLAFGLAALTRSMPLYYLPVAALLLAAYHGPRRGALWTSGLALGFCALTVPYSVALSRHLGTPTFIENHAGLRVTSEQGGIDRGSGRPPGILATGLALMRGFAEQPRRTVREWRETTRSILHVNGGRLLQIYLEAGTRWGSLGWKAAVHTFGDFPFIAVVLLAPFGLVWSRDRERAVLLAAWILLGLALTVLSGFGGSRLRAPMEPAWVVLAAAAVSGDRRRATSIALVAASLASVAFGSIVIPQLPRSLEAKGDYGVDWPLDPPPKRAPMVGEAGFNVLAADGSVEFALRPRNENGATRVTVSVEGTPAEEIVMDEEEVEHWFRLPWPEVDLVHVEVETRDARSGAGVRTLVVVPAR